MVEGFAQIGRGAHLQGKLSGKGAVMVQGELVGEVAIEGDLLVGAGGAVDAELASVQALRIEGKAKGEYEIAGPLELGPGGELRGKARARRLEISPAARLEAHLTIER
jgi:cytoskeletal protein CcmA (bactofilin family)